MGRRTTTTRRTAATRMDIVPQRWWLEPENEAHDVLWGLISKLRQQHAPHRDACMKHLRLYGGKETLAAIPSMVDAYIQDGNTGEVLSLDVTSGIVDSIHAKITKNRPKPFALSDGGTQEEQDRADGMGQFFAGAFYEHDAYELAEECQLDSMIVGESWLKVYSEGEDLCLEEVWDWEILIDNADGLYRNPRSIYQLKPYDREILIEKFDPGEDADSDARARFENEVRPAIERAPNCAPDEVGMDATADQVLVVEAWHLPSGRDAEGKPTGGRHCIIIEGCTLFDAPWARKRFPLEKLAWKPRRVGSRASGVVEELAPIQAAIYRLVDKIDEAHEALGKTFVITSGKTNVKQINNQVTSIIVDGELRTVTPAVVPSETYSWLQFLIQQAHDRIGASMLAVSSQKPSGLDSGKALRTYHDIETERFAKQARRYERFVVGIAELIREEAAIIAERNPAFAVRYVSQDMAKQVKWKDIANDIAVIQIFPTSFLSDTPAGRKQDVQDLIDLGVIQDPAEAKMFFDFPDIRSRLDPYVESHKLTMRQIDALLHEPLEQMPMFALRPEPHQDIGLCKRLALAAYLKARRSEVDETRCQLLRDYMLAAVDEEKRLAEDAAAGAGGAGAPMPGAPPDAPMPPPTEGMPGAMPPMPAAG